ncbi:MAG TPA: hypothetical protein VGG42_09375, partial [Acidobacteriaceae bacterium]
LFIPIQNVGNGPAVNVEMRVDDDVRDASRPLKWRIRNYPPAVWRPGTLYPRGPVWGQKLITQDTLTEEDYRRASQPHPKLRLYVFVRITFNDIFGKPHWQEICGWYDSGVSTPNHIEPCPKHNGTDSEQ